MNKLRGAFLMPVNAGLIVFGLLAVQGGTAAAPFIQRLF